MRIIDAHAHLWLWQDTIVNGQHNYQLPNGRAMFFGEEVQMLPPFMTGNRNSAEIMLSNMDYAQVSGAVITQEFIDGLQNDYLQYVGRRWKDRFFTFGMCEYRRPGFLTDAQYLIRHGFKGIKIPAARLITDAGRVWLNTPEFMQMYHLMEDNDVMLAVELAEGDTQVGELREIISECPALKIIIGHFGMVNRRGWMEQIKLASHEQVYVESGGITWLFNDEYYPFPSAVRAIREAADAVGIDKLMWGSDYPRTITAITYRQSFDWVLKSHELTDEEKEAFLSANAERLFGFNNLVELPYVKNMSE
ncbi:MAG: amidohydrolase [Prevotella sp.]|nr:amidohydrolase [Prevotella sp.]